MKSFFELKKHNTTVKREIIGGCTTFLTMAYIIFVNPKILSDGTGMDPNALITATILAAALGTLLVALWVKAPMAMAPGMGLNAFFTYTLVTGKYGVSWETALGVVCLSGIIFFLLTLLGFRKKIIHAIPHSLRLAVGAGIGLFIAFIGLKNMGIIGASPATLVELADFSKESLLGLLGIVIIAILEVRKVRGALLIGILLIYVLALITGVTPRPEALVSLPPSIAPIALKLDLASALNISLWGAIFSFMFVDLFDSVGTIVACSSQAGMIEKDGTIKNVDKMLEADAVATVAGSLFGTSTTTTYIESASGIADGARTGLASLVTALLFLLALFFSPIIGSVPSCATAPALVIVGVFMFRTIDQINFHDFTIAIPAFITIIAMPLTYSISNGICFGFISYVLIALGAGKAKKVPFLMWIIALLSVVNLYLGA